MKNAPAPSRLRLFFELLVINACTFGGGFVITSLMKKRFVEKLHWLSDEQMLDIVALAQSAPGAIAVNAAVHTGLALGGGGGAACAVLASVLPPLVLLSALSMGYEALRASLWAARVLQGAQLGVAAVLLDVSCSLWLPLLRARKALPLALLAAAFLLTALWQVNTALLLAGAAALGLVRALAAQHKGR